MLVAVKNILLGFGSLSGADLVYLWLLVLIPLAGLVLKTTAMTWAISGDRHAPRAMATYRLTVGTSLVAATINAVFGMIVAWVLVRYSFPGKRLIDGLVDLPFAMPTAVAGIALTSIYSANGWIGQYRTTRHAHRVHAAGDPGGADVHRSAVRRADRATRASGHRVELEEASASLGAGRWQTFRRVIMPMVLPALLTGFTLAFARALGEYGSVVFISGNQPMKTEITTLLIMTKLEQYDYTGATAIATVMLAASLTMLLLINALHGWARRSAAPA